MTDPATPFRPSLAAFVRPHAFPLAAGVLCVFGASACYMAAPLVVGRAVDTLQQRASGSAGIESVLGTAAALLVALAFARGLFNYGMRWLILGASRSVERDLRNALFARLQTLSAAWYDRTRSGDLLSRAINDIEGIRMMIGMGFFQGTNTLSMALLCIAGMLWISAPLTGLALLPLLAAFLVMHRLGDRLHRLSTAVQEQLSALSNRAQENFSGARVIRTYAQEANEEAAFEALNREYLGRNLDLARAQGLVNGVLTVLGESGLAVVLWYGGHEIADGGPFTLGDFLAFTFYQIILVWPVIALGWMLNLTQRGLACWDRIREVLETPSEVPLEGAGGGGRGTRDVATSLSPVPRPSSPVPSPPRIEFDRLTFAYGGGPPVLKDVSFTIEPGQVVAVVGRTGAGKSTLAHLLARFYPAPPGAVRIDGRDLAEIPPRVMRGMLGYVPQESFLFSEPIRENIRFGNPEAADEAVLLAARIAHLLPDIQGFPGQMGQLVGERGVTLSGGQKQRTSLARVVANDPRLVVLDDAFASVDTHTEAEIMAGLRPFLRGRTSILIAHRLATIRFADRIVVLDEGRVVEAGTHAELVRCGGLYAALAEQQAIEEALADA